VIMGHLSALSLRASDPRTEAALENMLTESRRMRDLIEDLIVLARLEESNGATDRIDLRAAVLEFAGARSTSGDPKIQLGALDGGNVKVSTSEIHGALTSLADNAAKYAPNSPVEIDLRSIDSTLQLRIMDRGPGMSEGDLDRALDRFYRGQAAANASGSGLGLAIIRRIMERAGGSIDIRNRTGGGLECTLTFPATASTDEFKPP
jgi:two-component system, OmpR family, sensor kinase